MPLANRVDPFGTLFATTERGTLFGNRGGRFHCVESQTVRGRSFATKQWICCRLAFKQRRRVVWSKGYTELFFSDEYAALAAGHRPCFECRREDAVSFAAAWGRASGEAPPRAPQMDAVLHIQRLKHETKRVYSMPAAALPDGAMIEHGGLPYLIMGEFCHLWTFSGYGEAQLFDRTGKANVLTPPTIISCLQHGYQPTPVAVG